MATELSMKDLKALLDENDLDLSMRQLTTIPAKALSKVPRATHLDFSNNLITTVPAELCFLTHITKLDLSNNHIVHLPEEFGKLINLAHLDLYKNEIEELPLSFGELVSLRWLDLKGNPLELELGKAAGDCQDEKGCKQAAQNVVRLMRDRAAKQQRLRDKQKIVTKQSEDSDMANHGSITLKEKTKKKKNKHRDSINGHPEPGTVQVQKTAMTFLWRSFVMLFLSSLVISGFVVAVVVSNCFGDSRQWLSSSKPFCKDLRNVVTENKFSPTVFGDFFLAVASLLKSYGDAAGDTWNELQRNGFIAFCKNYLNSLYMKLISMTLLVQGYLLHLFEDIENFYKAYAADAVNGAIRNVWLMLRILGLMLADLLMFIADKGLLFISSVVETVFTYAHRGDQLIEMLRKWWNTVK